MDTNKGFGVSDGKSGADYNYYLSQKPIGTGKTNSLSVAKKNPPNRSPDKTTDSDPKFYNYNDEKQTTGGITYDANLFTLVWTGYFVPQQSGSYEFCTDADNRDDFFLGSDNAFPCGSPSEISKSNKPLVESWYKPGGGDKQCKSVSLVAGYYYPLRSVYGNWGLPLSLEFTVKPPGGSASKTIEDGLAPESC